MALALDRGVISEAI
jgi:uncharacterized membrane protein YtjA (UPF0391 family)